MSTSVFRVSDFTLSRPFESHSIHPPRLAERREFPVEMNARLYDEGGFPPLFFVLSSSFLVPSLCVYIDVVPLVQ